MELLLDVLSVEPRQDFTLFLEFENGDRRIFDVKPLLEKKPFFKLKNKSLFLRATVENGTVVWPENIDIAPETLFDRSELVSSKMLATEKV